MTFDEHIAKRTGKPVDTDGVYPNQCMDLMHQYLIDCFGYTDPRILAAPSAQLVFKNFPSMFGREYFDRITRTPGIVPIKGDVMFWGDEEDGHVDIFINGDLVSFQGFDANWPLGSLPHVQAHVYDNVLGWLRPKINNSPNPPMATLPAELQHYSLNWKEIANKPGVGLDVNSAQFAEYRSIDKIISDKLKEESKKRDDALRPLGLDPSDLQGSFDRIVAKIKSDCQNSEAQKILAKVHEAFKLVLDA